MSTLKLLSGPRLSLTLWHYDKAAGKGHYETEDVTDSATERLFEAVTPDPDFRLIDLFKLLTANPVLQAIFRRSYAKELCEEAAKGPISKDAPQSERIEYLELYQRWLIDSDTGESSEVGKFNLHGVGFALEEDLNEDSGYCLYKKGDRIQWGISLTPVRELLHLPIRLNNEVMVCEDNLDAMKYGSSIQTLQNAHVTLGNFIHSVLWELSWHGTPEEASSVSEGLMAQVKEIEAGTLVTVAHEDVFESLGFTSQKIVNDHFFENSKEFSSSDIYLAVHNLEDEVLATDGLDGELDGKLLLRVEFHSLTGKALRRAMREFRHQN